MNPCNIFPSKNSLIECRHSRTQTVATNLTTEHKAHAHGKDNGHTGEHNEKNDHEQWIMQR